MKQKYILFNRLQNQHGISILLAVIALMMLSALGLGILSLTTTESLTATNLHDHTYALYLAEAGIERAINAVKNVSVSGNTYNAAADPYYQFNHDDSNPLDTSSPNETWDHGSNSCLVGSNADDTVTIYKDKRMNVTGFFDFQQSEIQEATLTGPIDIIVRGKWEGGTPRLRVSLCVGDSTDCSSKSDYSELYTKTLTILWPFWANYGDSDPLCSGSCSSWTWDDLANLWIMVEDVSSSSSAKIEIDQVYIKFPRRIDTTSSQFSGWTYDAGQSAYLSGAITLDKGSVETQIVAPSSAASAINVNYVNENLMDALCEVTGITSSSRQSQIYNSIESGRPYTSMQAVEDQLTDDGLDSFYATIENHLCVTSPVTTDIFLNDNNSPHASGQTSRPPININSASQTVIHAILEGITDIGTSDSQTLAQDIVDHRTNNGPFSCITSSSYGINSLHNLVISMTDGSSGNYLGTCDWGEVMDNADPSPRDYDCNQPESGGTTEFTVTDSNTGIYYITAVGTVGNISRSVQRIVYRDSSGNVAYDVPLSDGSNENSWEEIR